MVFSKFEVRNFDTDIIIYDYIEAERKTKIS